MCWWCWTLRRDVSTAKQAQGNYFLQARNDLSYDLYGKGGSAAVGKKKKTVDYKIAEIKVNVDYKIVEIKEKNMQEMRRCSHCGNTRE